MQTIIRKQVHDNARDELIYFVDVGLELCRLVQDTDGYVEITVPEPSGVGVQASVPSAKRQQWEGRHGPNGGILDNRCCYLIPATPHVGASDGAKC